MIGQTKSYGTSYKTERIPAPTEESFDCFTMVSICFKSKYKVFLSSIDL